MVGAPWHWFCYDHGHKPPQGLLFEITLEYNHPIWLTVHLKKEQSSISVSTVEKE